MSFTHRGGETLSFVVNAELLSLCDVGNYFKTPKRPTAFDGLYWQLYVYPNGDSCKNERKLCTCIFTSIGGFEMEFSLKIDRLDKKFNTKTLSTEEPKNEGPLIDHQILLSGDIIQDGEFTIHCKISFKKCLRKTREIPYFIKDSSIVKLKQHELERSESRQNILVSDKQIVNGIIWYNDYFPRGYQENNGYISGFLNIEYAYAFLKFERPITLQISYVLSVGGVRIYKTFAHTFKETTDNIGLLKLISHKLCKHADQRNGDIELMCSVIFSLPYALGDIYNHIYRIDLLQKRPSVNQAKLIGPRGGFFEHTETLQIDSVWLDLFEPGDCFSTPQRLVTGCNNLYWWIECYPNGKTISSQQTVSVFVCICTPCGKFKLTQNVRVLRSHVKYAQANIWDKSGHEGWENVISHDELRLNDTIKDGFFVIQCDLLFELSKKFIKKLNAQELFKDKYTIKFDRKLMETSNLGIVEPKQSLAGLTWWIQYFPCGEIGAHEEHICVCFHKSVDEVVLDCFCAITIDGVLIKKSNDDKSLCNFIRLSHKLCKLADHKEDIIDVICEVTFFRPEYQIDDEWKQRGDCYKLEYTEKLTVDSDWLNQFKAEDCLSTPRKLVKGCNNFYWWIQCYPNGKTISSQQNVSVFVCICTPCGDFKLTQTVTVLRSDIKHQTTKTWNQSGHEGWENVITHDELRRNDTIKDGLFVIKCDLLFKISKKLIKKLNAQNYHLNEDMCIVKLDRKLMNTCLPGQRIVQPKRTMDGMLWWIHVYPCGVNKADNGYISVCFHNSVGQVVLDRSCGVAIDGVLIKKSNDDKSLWNSIRLSHELCEIADHEDDIIDLICEIRFFGSIEKTFSSVIKVWFDEERLKDNNRTIECTPKQYIGDSDQYKHTWRLICYPTGDSANPKSHVSLKIEASTTETRAVIVNGVVELHGTSFQKKFKMRMSKEDCSFKFTNLISHKQIREYGGITNNGMIVFICYATFAVA